MRFDEFVAAGGAFQGYAYSYPHKLAYRAFDSPIPLADAWADECQDALFLYLHVPFCEMRCGFCNLLTIANSKEDAVNAYLSQLARQTDRVRQILPAAQIARVAVDGGTPTYLDLAQLQRLFANIANFGADLLHVPASVELSPATIDADKLAFLREQGVHRVSMGVQSFYEDETKMMGRPQRRDTLEQALRLLSDSAFPVLNLDLIYGLKSHNADNWGYSLAKALQWQPQEIFLYPLYVRALTGLDGRNEAADHRLALYRQGRDFLLENGYEQISMRSFRRSDTALGEMPAYSCQEDGMVGLGAGARSYARHVHYSSEFGVKRQAVRAIIQQFVDTAPDDFAWARHGFRLSEDERKRRHIIKSILHTDGLSAANYRANFASDPLVDCPQLAELIDCDYLRETDGGWQATPEGFAYSDAIGPWLYSAAVQERIGACEQR